LLINGRQNAGHTQAHRADMGVGWSAGVVSTTATEHLAPCQKLGMNLQPDNSLVVHRLSHLVRKHV
jgi:hypothetical protein